MCNLGKIDRTVRVVAGIAVIIWGVMAQNYFGAINFNVLPNPFKEQVDLIFEENAIYEIKILDLLGKLVFSTTINGRRKITA